MRGVLLVLLLVVPGCAPLPWRGPDPVPAGFSLGAREIVRPGSPLTLEAAIRIAHAGNPQALAARYLEQQAEAVRMQQIAPALPQVRLSGRAARYLDPQRVASPSSTGTTPTSVSAEDLGTWDATVSLNLFAGGRDWWRIRMARELVEAARLDSLQARRVVTSLVAVAYYQAVWRRAVADALLSSAKALEAEAARAKALLEEDKASLLEVTRVRVRAAEVLDRAREEASLAELALLQLFHLLGVPTVVEVKLEPPPEVPEGAVPDEARIDFVALLARRPDLKAARLRVSAQQAKILGAQAELWPQLALAGSFGQRVDLTAWPVEDGHWRNSGYLGMELAWSPFEGGRVHYLVEQERAALRVQIEQLRALELAAVLEIRTALYRLRSARDRLGTAREALTLAKTSLELEQKKVELGQSTFTDYQIIEAAYLDARVRVLQLSTEARIAWLQYRLAAGEW